ncbi:MAG: PAS domain-containing protein [Megasphaera sp.]|uniref:helix-turn-helix transcriptional regulator n=1 Tax=Megasphaera sueciensis TaxID=349094 RepID=UPI003D015732|nr:PAS domain-containing protein [Megasphaera sp.]MCI1823207.1 PAS domain-containing protein [Megasphaera sp.]
MEKNKKEKIGKSILRYYIPMVRYIADIIGPHCEVVLHDVQTPGTSIIAIRNGYVSGRTIGGPLTNLGLKLIESSPDFQEESLVNYASKTSNGENLVSSTYFIRDDEGKLVGMLCVNILKSGVAASLPQINNVDIHRQETLNSGVHDVNEWLRPSSDQVVSQAVQDLVEERETTVARLTFQEKKEIIHLLKKNGIFKIKGAVNQVSKLLNVAGSTIYRYLSQTK